MRRLKEVNRKTCTVTSENFYFLVTSWLFNFQAEGECLISDEVELFLFLSI